MAVDTEAKRWSMMQWASGPARYPILFNPDTSSLQAIERATVLKLYGGIAWESPAATAAVTGTVLTAVETDIVTGGQTIVITLTNDTWVASGASFNAVRQDIIDGLDSAGAEATGWNAEVRDKEVVGAVVRTSDTVVTITLSAAAAYDITAAETITVTVPASALVTSGDPVVATPTFTIQPVVAVAEGATGGWIRRKPPSYYEEDEETRRERIRRERLERGITEEEPAETAQEAPQGVISPTRSQEALEDSKRLLAVLERLERQDQALEALREAGRAREQAEAEAALEQIALEDARKRRVAAVLLLLTI